MPFISSRTRTKSYASHLYLCHAYMLISNLWTGWCKWFSLTDREQSYWSGFGKYVWTVTFTSEPQMQFMNLCYPRLFKCFEKPSLIFLQAKYREVNMMMFTARVHKTWMTRIIRVIKPTSMECAPLRFPPAGKVILPGGQSKTKWWKRLNIRHLSSLSPWCHWSIFLPAVCAITMEI